MIRNLLISLLYSFLSIFIKRKDNIIAFGSWAGEMYADNSKYLLEYILKNYPGRFKLYWVGNKSIENSIPQGVTFLEKDKLSTGIILLKAKYFFCTQMHRADICKYNVYQGCKIIYLDHGLAIKRWAMDIVNYNGELEEKNIVKRIYHFVTGESKKYDYFATSSPLMDKVYCSSLKYRGSSIEKMLQCGIPRNDYLIDNKDNQEEILRIKDKYSKLLGFDKKKKIVLYVPTYRKIETERKSFASLNSFEEQRLVQILKQNNAIILEKGHFVTQKRKNESGARIEDYIININIPVDIQELDLISDIHITDYSGSFLDFILLDKPVIHYIYDYEYYRDVDTGLYYPIEEYAAGFYSKESTEVIDEIERLLKHNDRFVERRHKIRNVFLEYEDGTASKRICNKVLHCN